MQRLPEIQSLVAQTVGILREQIQSGCWEHWLPGELELAAQLHVSRVTLRTALRQLEREKWLRAGQGRRRAILRPPPRATQRAASRKVLLLSPIPVAQFTSLTMFWVEAVREQLAAENYELQVQAGAEIYRQRPSQALERLVEREPSAGWILYRSTAAMQQWFSARRLPAVVAGTRHHGADCPSVDIDHQATCRHAVGLFLARGHRRLALLIPGGGGAGDRRSAEGFRAGAALARTHVQAVVAEHDGTVAGVGRVLEELRGCPAPATGLLVARVPHLLTVYSWLGHRQVAIPGQLAVISRDEDPVLDHLVPSVARYAVDPGRFAGKLTAALRRRLAGELPSDVYLMPRFRPGVSLG